MLGSGVHRGVGSDGLFLALDLLKFNVKTYLQLANIPFCICVDSHVSSRSTLDSINTLGGDVPCEFFPWNLK